MSLKLTSGYRLDLTQISRILDHCARADEQLSKQQLTDAVGLSGARVSRLWMMGTALGLFVKGEWAPSQLGCLVWEHDRFLDDLGTLWLLHYVLASNPDIVVWNTMTSVVIPENRSVTMDVAKPYFTDQMEEFSSLSYDVYLNKEIRSFFNAYTEQKFQYLNYLSTKDNVEYTWGQRESIPPIIAFASILLYRTRFLPNVVTMDLTHLTVEPNSIGKVFNLTVRQAQDLLEEIERYRYLYVETRADLDQIRFRDHIDFLETVRRYYEDR